MSGAVVKRALAIVALCAGCHSSGKRAADAGVDASFATTSFDLSCASSTQQAKLVPVNLVVLLDRSGSMGDGVNGDPALKWNPVTAALGAFFADPMSAGMNASLQLFPAANDQCNPSVYYFAAVPERALPDGQAFAAAMAAATPSGDTPTRPAILGAIDYAKEVRDATPGSRTAIVLVTDGDPDVCDSSVSNVSLEVAKVASTIKTYVIGVGQSLSSLDMIAKAGGTDHPTLVSVGDPAATKRDFLTALQQIRGLVLSCEVPLPAPPPGMMLDFTSVNVLFTPSAAPATQLLYDSGCSTGVGWRYDDPAKPTEVQLCGASCDAVRADHGGRLDVIFGCATSGNLIE